MCLPAFIEDGRKRIIFLQHFSIRLESQTRGLTSDACKVKANIRLSQELLRIKQGIEAEDTRKTTRHRDVLA